MSLLALPVVPAFVDAELSIADADAIVTEVPSRSRTVSASA